MKISLDKIKSFSLAIGAALLLTACSQEERTTAEETEAISTETTTDHSQHNMDTGTGKMSGMMGHMHKNMEEMKAMKANMTGDPDHDFAQMMTHHHQGAIRMAEEELANGKDSKMKQMAQKTKESNQADIQKLQAFISNHKPTTGDTAATMKMMHPMNNMMGQMHQQDMSGMNTDQNFAQMMVHHHQMGNEMSKEFLKQGKTPEMKQLTQKMIDQQTKEIKELEAWQQQNQK